MEVGLRPWRFLSQSVNHLLKAREHLILPERTCDRNGPRELASLLPWGTQ
jgi:hypothetical protein